MRKQAREGQCRAVSLSPNFSNLLLNFLPSVDTPCLTREGECCLGGVPPPPPDAEGASPPAAVATGPSETVEWRTSSGLVLGVLVLNSRILLFYC